MILEVVELFIQPGTAEAFDAAIRMGVETVIAKSHGFLRYEIQKGIETPERYLLMIEWETVEDHTVGFRGSEAFTQWRAIVSPFFTKPPHMEHFTCLSGTRA